MADDNAVATRTLLGLGLVVLGVALFRIPGVPVDWTVALGAIYWTVALAGGVMEAGGRRLRSADEGALVSLVAVVMAAIAVVGATALAGDTRPLLEQLGLAASLLAPALAFPLGLAASRQEHYVFGALVAVGLGWAAVWVAPQGPILDAVLAVGATALCSVPTAAYGRKSAGQRVPLMDQ